MRTSILSLVFLIVSMNAFAAQDISCKAILGTGKLAGAQFAKLRTNEKELLKASRWLQKESANIDPSVTHLQGVVPLISDYISDVRAQLPVKSDEPLYALKSNQILQILNETQSRIASRTLTYEFVYALPFRISMFLNMKAPLAEQGDVYFQMEDIRKNADGVAPSLQDSSYLTHENFIALLKSLSTRFYSKRDFFNDNIASEFSFWIHVDLALRNFKTAKLLPFIGELSIETMNEMSHAGVWPLGTFLKPVTLDGLNYTERGATLHDLLHATLYFFDSTAREHYFHPPVRFEILDSVKRGTYSRIQNSSTRDPDQKWLLEFIQHILFHELGRDAYEIKSGSDRDRGSEIQVSIESIKNIFDENLRTQFSPELEPSQKNLSSIISGLSLLKGFLLLRKDPLN